ncbi:MotA/TolQ/ExbB proton channel [Thermocrinis albus DSM 14484]|uniref:MotA/TolQ/ExbB proton channel n=1 Tax=Thermocrinis albus (strain DSM 14484 / JCM 11386 / HI 11/12) TaxID=638303 RepID=D3SLD6_THEAH|nr:MotA/TolQ/ExbB proton channel family protein [Thermocrinis albus]ADC89566.1 MotA/TolQ/ExbB proton channel [Thermocrinis albus DSM 14484]
MDLLTLVGILGGLTALLIGAVLKGASLLFLLQPAAFVIVVPTTLFASLVTVPLSKFYLIVEGLRMAFRKDDDRSVQTKNILIDLAHTVRKEGMLALETKAEDITDPFIRKAVDLMVLGVDEATFVESLETEVAKREEELEIAVEYWKNAAESAPTFGLVGAVFGLMKALQSLDNAQELAHGISAAFVATVYGITSSYLIFGPIAKKIKIKGKEEILRMYMVVEAGRMMIRGENPRLIEERLNSFVEAKG